MSEKFLRPYEAQSQETHPRNLETDLIVSRKIVESRVCLIN